MMLQRGVDLGGDYALLHKLFPGAGVNHWCASTLPAGAGCSAMSLTLYEEEVVEKLAGELPN